MKAILLHLSDSHIHNANSPVLSRHRQIAATLRPILADVGAIFIVYTGDITQSGEAEEFRLARTFVDELRADLRKDFLGQIEILVTPGNHDGTFKQSKSTRTHLVKSLRSETGPSIDDDVIDVCTEPLAHYYQFEGGLGTTGMCCGDKLWKDYRYTFGEKTLRFSAINPSWVATVPEGEAVFPVERYKAIQEDTANINILMMHHPLNWYAQTAYHPLREMAKANYQMVMSGHEHNLTTSLVSDLEKRSSLFFEAAALDENGSSGYAVILIDIDKETVAPESFAWDGECYRPPKAFANWGNTQPIPKRRPKNGFHLTDRAKSWLEALDASFLHPEREVIQLSDVFVSPDLTEFESEKDEQDVVNASVFLQLKEEHRRVLIYGDEQFGKTCLLKHLYAQFLCQGLKPLLFDAKDAIDGAEHFRRHVDRLVADQYGDESVHKYAQVPFEEKVALVDNLDEVGSRGDVLARVLRNIEGQFGRVITTAGERYEVSVISSTEAAKATTEYKDFRMLGFGYKLRHDLIRRWYEIGSPRGEVELQEKVHSAERAINSVLSKGLVPMTAFNTLVLLQTIEVNERGSLANAGTAQYYEYMFRHSLTLARVKADEIDEIQSYLVYLAWEYFQSKEKVLSAADLMRFNQWFSDEMHPTDPIERLRLLERTKILVARNGGYAFAYSYLEYFFVAKYLAIHSEKVEIRDLIKHLCAHLYLRENANVVLFLTHHIQSDWVIQEIADLLTSILGDIPILRLEDDAELLNTWVSNKAKIVVDATNVVENNREARKTEDKAAELPEPMLDKEVSSIQELDQVTQLNLLFKTSEILGQVIKGRYGSIPKDVKTDLVKRLFDAPLRGVNYFISVINSAPDAVLMEITDRLKKNWPSVPAERADKIAKRFIFNVLGAVADSFVSRQGEIIGSPKLSAIIDQVARAEGSLAYQIVKASSKLSYPGNPPSEEIKALAESMDRNYFGYKLLQGQVARHLYMFHMPHAEKVRLAAAAGIDLETQRGIELKSHATKKLPGQQSKPVHAQSLLKRLQGSFLMRNKAVVEAMEERYAKKGRDKKVS
ncbi:metallophosphoesterase [Aromatoleum toluclasticum]|uniref:metallophosphoesterase n=1 Tax=Aromatoleum toluclasticum TaxID=92003 RepID=UPI000374D30E|nr:metallophosphoesterase [Aromatoleum toluclasticum]